MAPSKGQRAQAGPEEGFGMWAANEVKGPGLIVISC